MSYRLTTYIMTIGNVFQHGGVMDSVYVTTRGRIVIPARLRRKLCIKTGTKVCFIERGNDILFQPVTKGTFEVCAACSRTQHQRLQNC